MSEAAAEVPPLPQPSLTSKVLKNLSWVALFLGLLVFFTAIKIPSEKIKGYIQREVANSLAYQGIGFSADRGSLTLGFGIGYRFESVTLTPRPPASLIRLDSLEVQPALLKFLTGNLGGRMLVSTGGGKIDISASMPKPGAIGVTQTEFQISDLDLGKAGFFSLLGGIQGKAVAEGEGTLSGNLQDTKTLNGEVHFNLKKIVIDEQTLYGFKIPQLLISDAKIDLSVTDGRAIIKTLKLGREGSSDDLIANVTGDILLRAGLGNPDFQIKAKFKVSDKVKQAFTLLDALLGAGRQADGSYAYTISGPMSGPPTLQPGI